MAVALYARVSTTRQAEADLSIPDQLKQMRAWCHVNGLVVAKEYVEAGASAMDDKRPAFQQMIATATLKPSPFDSIIVHSRSRFFRDLFDCLRYERMLKKSGVKLISITQLTSDDAQGDMMAMMISMFDEYQSKENSKHTLRSMKENASQGYFNGSRAPFGYRIVEADKVGNRGRMKKRLEVDPEQAAVVRKIYDFYLNGHQGQPMGMKAIATWLTGNGITFHGRPWSIQKIQHILSDTVYKGEYTFNRRCSKDLKIKAREEWVKTSVTPIIDEETFQKTEEKRKARSSDRVPPRILNSPTLLTGLIKCSCGAAMTTASAKSGQYYYYKCSGKNAKGICHQRDLPMEKTDRLVLERMVERVLNPARVQHILGQLKARLNLRKPEEENKKAELNRQLKDLGEKLNRLYEAIENGLVCLDETLKQRVSDLQIQRDGVQAELKMLAERKEVSLRITPTEIAAFTTALKEKLLCGDSGFAKHYLRMLVDEIRVSENMLNITGSKVVLIERLAEMKKGTESVPSSSFH